MKLELDLGRAAAVLGGGGRGVLGAIVGVGGLAMAGTPVSGALWAAAVLVACSGYGAVIERVLGRRQSPVMLVILGLAVLLASSTLVAHLGLLARPVQLGAVALGLVICAVPRVGDAAPAPRLSRVAMLVTLVACALLAGIELVHPGVPLFDEEANHVLAVKQLWDTGALPALHHQAGAQVIGESYFALATGAHMAALFDGGICVGLLVLLLAELVAADGIGLVVFIMLAAPIILNPEPRFLETPRWAATVLHVASWVALERALAARPDGAGARRIAWVTIATALALAVLRHEHAVLAVVYIAAAVVLPRAPGLPSRRTLGLVALVWLVGATALGIALGARLAPGKAALVLLAIPAAAFVLWLLRPRQVVDAFAVLVLAVVANALAAALGLVPPSARGTASAFPPWFAIAAAVIVQIDGSTLDRARHHASRVRLPTALIVLVLLVGVTMLGANFNDMRRARLRERFTQACDDLEQVVDSGYDLDADTRIRTLQALVGEGIVLGFWGQSASRIDFTRNAIRDVSFARRRRGASTFLLPLSDERLAGLDYLIVEEIPRPPIAWDLWGAQVRLPFDALETRLEPIAQVGSTRLYRIVR